MPEPSIADVMRGYAADAVAHAKKCGVPLDFTEGSLAEVDGLLARLRGDEVTPPDSPEAEELLWMLAKMYGGYVGEVVLKVLGGAWDIEDLPGGDGRPVIVWNLIRSFPPEKVYKYLTEDPYSGVSGYCRAMRGIAGRQDE